MELSRASSLKIRALKKLTQLAVPNLVFFMEIRLHRETELLKTDLGLVHGIIVDCYSIGNGRKGG